ncbi:MAG: hypothetical protein NC833_04610 [Candidatus Omnitrophica bacterium]|nr:hypothetical protein [Candidatus Omnitrophota bacterium]
MSNFQSEGGEKKYRKIIFISVGTSLLSKTAEIGCTSVGKQELLAWVKDYKRKVINEQEIKKSENPNLDTFYNEYSKKIDLEEQIKRRVSLDPQCQISSYPDFLSAEIASLYLFYSYLKTPGFLNYENLSEKNEGVTEKNKDKIILISSDTDEGIYCACFLSRYFKEKDPFSQHVKDVEIIIIGKLIGEEGDKFSQEGLDNLIIETTTCLKKYLPQYKDKIFFNLTGSYKGILPHLSILGMLFEGVQSFYLFELSPKLVFIPKLPISFDILTYRNLRGYFKAIPHLKISEEEIENLVGRTFKRLFVFNSEKNTFELNPFGKTIQKIYEEERGGEISEYGRGYLLTDLIKDKVKRNGIRKLIDYWQHLWIGDLIPETVEHARGHTQRNLELAAQVISYINEKNENFFNDDELLVFISLIWLHDIGHSGNYFEYNNQKLNLEGFPSFIRYFHSFLTYYLLKKEKNNFFRNCSIFNDNLIEIIRLLALYHIGKMPVVNNDSSFKKADIEVKETLSKAVENFQGGKYDLIGALFRVIDASDVQEERTISDEYIKMREIQNERIIERLKEDEKKYRNLVNLSSLKNENECYSELMNLTKDFFDNGCQDEKTLEKLDKQIDECIEKFLQNSPSCDNSEKEFLRLWLSILNQYCFKKRQPSHFKKHKGISAIIYLRNPENKSKINEYHFGVLAVYKNDDTKNVENVLRDIYNEYEKVKPILNNYKIYFDSYWYMKEEEQNKTKFQI